MSVYLRDATRGRKIDRRTLEAAAQRLLEAVGEGGSSLALSLVGDAAIRRLNREHRGRDDAPLEAELQRLLIHGILHLLGHDHERPAERAEMEAEERRLAAAIGMPWPY